MKISITFSLIFIVLALTAQCLFPTPQKVEFGQAYENGLICFELEMKISMNVRQYGRNIENGYFKKIKERIERKTGCRKELLQTNKFQITVKHDGEIQQEGYRIQALQKHAQIYTSSYSGLVYALQTFSQMFKEGNRYESGFVEDFPLVQHRGIMIDSVRHFLSIAKISKLIESMPLGKLNILHWHLADDEAFTMELAKHPQLANAGKYTPTSFYSIQEVKSIIDLAEQNGVKIVPEFDTPGHIRAWGLSDVWKSRNITILCPKGEGYNHQFDLSMNDSYKLAQQVLNEVDIIFKDSPYLHLGGDEVFGSCWDQRPSIKTFMKLKNIKTYGQLQMYWRFEMKQVLGKTRKTVYWLNGDSDVSTSPDDILHYWGKQADTAQITESSQSKIILSPFDFLYLNLGKGNIWNNATSGPFSTWKQIYQNFTIYPPNVDKSRILGAEVCLWGEVSNEETLENNIWMRGIAFAAKAWSNIVLPLEQAVDQIVQIQQTLKSMGVQPSPIVSEFCEVNPIKCFKGRNKKTVSLINQ